MFRIHKFIKGTQTLNNIKWIPHPQSKKNEMMIIIIMRIDLIEIIKYYRKLTKLIEYLSVVY